MADLLLRLMPHSHCFLGHKEWQLAYLFANSIIGVAYLCISANLIFLYLRRRDFDHIGTTVIYGSFILACGVGHLIMVANMYLGMYPLESAWHLLTAAFSSLAAFKTLQLTPVLIHAPRFNVINEYSKRQIEHSDDIKRLEELTHQLTVPEVDRKDNL